ncbi:MAG: hypothetical protein J7K66_03905 [Anaerolineaceae bacterium]|nr:hypothetical protein [Anaerolineaceae bacterium]
MAINIGSVTIGNLWKSQTELFNLVISHLNRYPAMEVQDVYTLIYQGAMGVDNYSADAGVFEERLIKEFEETTADEGQALWETIRPDGELVRVHIAALKARGGKQQVLSTLCMWTASVFRGDKEDLQDGWDTFQRLCRDNRLRKFPENEIYEFTEWVKKNEYPSTRHSIAFRDAYHPHYRLVMRGLLNLLME